MRKTYKTAAIAVLFAIASPAFADEIPGTMTDGTIVVSQGIVVLPTMPRPPEPMPLDAD